MKFWLSFWPICPMNYLICQICWMRSLEILPSPSSHHLAADCMKNTVCYQKHLKLTPSNLKFGNLFTLALVWLLHYQIEGQNRDRDYSYFSSYFAHAYYITSRTYCRWRKYRNSALVNFLIFTLDYTTILPTSFHSLMLLLGCKKSDSN